MRVLKHIKLKSVKVNVMKQKLLRVFLVSLAFLGLSVSSLTAQTWPPLGMLGNGTSGNPWQIATAAQLKALEEYVNSANGPSMMGYHFKLMNNIDLSGYPNWNPIGDNTQCALARCANFQGNFDGNGYAVQNLTINRPTMKYVGLFGYVSTYAMIKNLGVVNCNVIGYDYVGGLAGYLSGGDTITNCYVTGSVSGHSFIGGLVGANTKFYSSVSTISNSYAACSVNGVNAGSMYVGGLVGSNGQDCSISNCYATGNVSGISDVGGLVGANSGTISKCYATGNINGTSWYVGGLVGSVGTYSYTYNSYATGRVSGGSCIGGLIGYIYGGSFPPPYIENCYATGNVSATGSYVGGLIGYGYGHSNYRADVRNCVAANDTVKTTMNTADIDRIMGASNNNISLFNGYALNNMVVLNSGGVKAITSGIYTNSGQNIPLDSLQSRVFYSRSLNWVSSSWSIQNPSGIWDICDGKTLPWLRWQGISCIDTFSITATAGSNGSINPSGTVRVVENTNKTFTFSANIGYEIDQILIDGVNVPDSIAGGSYTFTNITANHSIHVSFSQPDAVKYTITATAGANGSISPLGEINVEEGEDQTFTFTAGNGYEIDEVLIDGTNNPAAVTAGLYTFENVRGNHTIEVSFKEIPIITHTITASAGTGGSVSPSGNINIIEGKNQAFVFAAENGYEIDEVLIDGINYPSAVANEFYIFYNVTKNHSIAVSFKQTVGIKQLIINNEQLTIYPNPTDGKLTIRNEESEGRNVEIYDIVGRNVGADLRVCPEQQGEYAGSPQQIKIDISHLASGMYFLRVDNKMFKVIKQ